MTKSESLEKIESLIRRTGSNISNKASAAGFIVTWTALGASSADPFNLEPKNGLEAETINSLKRECYKAADIVATWQEDFITKQRVRSLFSIPEVCEEQIKRLSLHQKRSFLKASILSPYKAISHTTTLYSTDEFKQGFLRRHVDFEISCPGAYSHRRNPYGEVIREIALIASALKTASSATPPPLPPLSPSRGFSI